MSRSRPSPASVRSGRLDRFERSWQTRRLANGMHAVHVPDPTSDAFAIGMVVRCGSRVESSAVSGISHFLEHVLFRGSRRFPDYTRLASEFEWLGGDWNAATGHEQTEYGYDGIVRTGNDAMIQTDFAPRRPRRSQWQWPTGLLRVVSILMAQRAN